MFAITGNKKRGDECASLFIVRVDGVVGHQSLSFFLSSLIEYAGLRL